MTRKPVEELSKYGPQKGTKYDMKDLQQSNYFADPAAHAADYQKQSIKGESDLPIRSFSRSKKSTYMANVSDIHYLTVLDNVINCESGNGETALTALLTSWFTSFYTRANDKDLTAGNDTAFYALACDVAKLLYEYITQKHLRDIGNSLTENSATSGSAAVPAYWTQEDWDFVTAKLDNYGPVPHICYDIINQLCKFRVKVTKEFTRWKEVIPPSYFLFWKPQLNKADFVALRDGLKAQRVKSKTFMDKFGIAYDDRIDVSKLQQVEVTWKNIDVRAMCNHLTAIISYNGASRTYLYPNGSSMIANQAASYTERKYFFEDAPKSKIHALCPLLGRYDATNNNYGLLELAAPTVDGDWNCMHAAEDDLVFTRANVITHGFRIFKRLMGAVSPDGTENAYTYFMMTCTGDTSGTPWWSKASEDDWLFNNDDDVSLVYGDGIGYDEARSNLINILSTFGK